MEDLRQLIAQQNHLLFRLIDVLESKDKPSEQQLGFGTPPRPVYVFANRSKGEGVLWYTLSEDADRKAQPIMQTALTGYLEKLEVKQLERRGKDTSKLHIYIKANRTYIIETGLDSLFSRSMISSIAALTPEQVRQPVTIEVQPGDSDEVLFGRLYSGGEHVFAPYGDNPDWQALTQAAIDAIQGSGLSASASPQYASVSQKTSPELVDRLSELMTFTGHQAAQVATIAASPMLRIDPDDMSESEYIKLRSCLLADHGFRKGVFFNSKKDAWEAAKRETESIASDADAIGVWHRFVADLIQKLATPNDADSRLVTAGNSTSPVDDGF